MSPQRYKKRAVTAEERRQIAIRYGASVGKSVDACCIYCGSIGRIHWIEQSRGDGWVQFENLEIEHKHPEFLGGSGGGNLDVACRHCNRSKGYKTADKWRLQ